MLLSVFEWSYCKLLCFAETFLRAKVSNQETQQIPVWEISQTGVSEQPLSRVTRSAAPMNWTSQFRLPCVCVCEGVGLKRASGRPAAGDEAAGGVPDNLQGEPNLIEVFIPLCF